MTDTSIASAEQPRGRFLRIRDIVQDSGLSEPTIHRLHRQGDFPRKVHLTRSSVGWWESEYLAWKASRERVAVRN
jgi:prophage regulatory protein